MRSRRISTFLLIFEIALQNLNFAANCQFRCGSAVTVRRRRDAPGVRVHIPRHADLGIRVPQVHVVEQVDDFQSQLDVAVRAEGMCLKSDASTRQ